VGHDLHFQVEDSLNLEKVHELQLFFFLNCLSRKSPEDLSEDVDDPCGDPSPPIQGSSSQSSRPSGEADCSKSRPSTPSGRAGSPVGATPRPGTRKREPSVAQVLGDLRADFRARNDARAKEHQEKMEAVALSNRLKERKMELLEKYCQEQLSKK
jgi:hypothetical protein